MGIHTVEKIGGTSMTRFGELLDNILIADRKGNELYNRIFIVSAYGGITNLLLEDKKTGEPGVYGKFADGSKHIFFSGETGKDDERNAVASAFSVLDETVNIDIAVGENLTYLSHNAGTICNHHAEVIT